LPDEASEGLAALQLEELDPERLFGALDRHGVRYVLIGGLALVAAGLPLVTIDVDICYDAGQVNRRALARALRDLNAVPVDAGNRPLGREIDPRTLQLHDTFLFATDAGRVDCLRVPTGTGGYAGLARTAIEQTIGGVPVRVASLEDLRRMKRATNRPKDRLALELLGALEDQIDRTPASPTNPADLPEERAP
jgi:hypothetical protein